MSIQKTPHICGDSSCVMLRMSQYNAQTKELIWIVASGYNIHCFHPGCHETLQIPSDDVETSSCRAFEMFKRSCAKSPLRPTSTLTPRLVGIDLGHVRSFTTPVEMDPRKHLLPFWQPWTHEPES